MKDHEDQHEDSKRKMKNMPVPEDVFHQFKSFEDSSEPDVIFYKRDYPGCFGPG